MSVTESTEILYVRFRANITHLKTVNPVPGISGPSFNTELFIEGQPRLPLYVRPSRFLDNRDIMAVYRTFREYVGRKMFNSVINPDHVKILDTYAREMREGRTGASLTFGFASTTTEETASLVLPGDPEFTFILTNDKRWLKKD